MFLEAVMAVFLVFIILRLLNLQFFNHDFYTALASEQHEVYRELVPKRGVIYFQDSKNDSPNNLYPVAINKDLFLLYAVPMEIKDPVDSAYRLAKILNIEDEDEIHELVNKLAKPNDPYEVIAKGVEEKIILEINNLDIVGIRSVAVDTRFYPENNIGANVLGFLGNSDDKQTGLYGIEGYFNEELEGKNGFLETETDIYGRWITLGGKQLKKAQDGSSIILTIERAVEFMACNELNATLKQFDAEGGSVIIEDPKTGRILAMCSSPDFNPNEYGKIEDIDDYNNQGIFKAYEPGSTFKAITLAAALDMGLVTPDSTYNDEGHLKIADFDIKNSDYSTYGARGIQTMTQVLELSLNTGAMYAAKLLGKENFKKYIRNFGFGEPTGITLATEMEGDMSSLDRKGEIYLATASFGQGTMVTAMQMLKAYSTFANQGKLLKPYIVEEIIDSEGNHTKFKSQEIREIIKPRTAALISGMLAAVVKEGHAKGAQMKNYYIAGKTGTAQVAKSGGGGYSEKTIHSFVGFGPVANPAFVMIVRLDNPKDARFAESSVVPLFHKIAEFVLNYYAVPPDVK